MTLTNGASGFSMPTIPNTLDPATFSATANLQLLLQTNNDLILAIHKALVDSNQEMNRKIEGLRDDLRDIKLSLSKNDNILQQESNNWRQHTESLLAEQGERYSRQTDRLQNMLMDLIVHQPIVTTKAFSPKQQEVNALKKQIPTKTTDGEQKIVEKMPSQAKKEEKVEEPKGFKPSLPTAQVEVSKKLPDKLPSLKTASYSADSNILIDIEQNKEQARKEIEFVATTAPAKTSQTIATTVPAVSFSVSPIMTAAVTAPVTTTTPYVTPNFVNFSFKNSISGTGLFGAAAPPITTSASKTGTGFGLFGEGGGSGFGGGSLFGGAGKTGSNTFANLAAKAAESGGGFLNANTTNKPQFGQSPFGGGPKDYKLFQQPSPHQSLNASTRSSLKGADETRREEEGSDKEEETEDYTPDVHFEPVIPLPPKVEEVSGEEEEEVLFTARCKLYRFDRDTKENKERGLGEIKILYHPSTNNYRCVMRREQVFKLCANFRIVADLKFQQREGMPSVYTWACKDFSDDMVNGTDETFSARFKDAGIAREFYERMMEAIEHSDSR